MILVHIATSSSNEGSGESAYTCKLIGVFDDRMHKVWMKMRTQTNNETSKPNWVRQRWCLLET